MGSKMPTKIQMKMGTSTPSTVWASKDPAVYLALKGLEACAVNKGRPDRLVLWHRS